MDLRYAPKAPRFSTMIVTAHASNVGNLTANTTNTFFLATPPGKYFIYRASFTVNQVPVDADGTILATFKKWDGVAGAGVALNTAAQGSATTGDLESAVAKNTHQVPLLATLTDAQRTILNLHGDSLYVEVVSNSAAIDTQPTNLGFSVELLALE